ncbi:CPBP family intramembrane glutamic endopeptidase [Liquorilactobacillus mali]|nr:CPBP family intramembrane glutamic endopeptidase [Liquorilactobacillus mali]
MLTELILIDRFFLVLNVSVSYKVFLQDFFLLITFYVINHFFLHIHFLKRIKQNFFSVIKINLVPLIFSLILITGVFSTISIWHSNFLHAFIIAGSASVFEEFFFRGLLLNTFLTQIKSSSHKCILISTLLTSILFSLSHAVNINFQSLSGTLFQMISVFFLGILLAAIYLRTGSLMYPIFFHFILDFSTILMKGFVTASPTKQTLISNIFLEFIYILTAIVLLRNSKTTSIINTNKSIFNNN